MVNDIFNRSRQIMLISTIFIFLLMVTTYKRLIISLIVSFLFVIPIYFYTIYYVFNIRRKTTRSEIDGTFPEIKRFVKENYGENIIIEAITVGINANIMIYVRNVDKEQAGKMIDEIIKYMQLKGTYNVYYTIQATLIINKKEIRKKRKIFVKNVKSERRNRLRSKEENKEKSENN